MTKGPAFDGRLRPPHQARSRDSLERILAAVERLLDGRPFDEITTQAIIDEADVSRSTFYARFPSKEDLLPHMYHRYIERASTLLDEALAIDSDVTTRDLVERLVRSYLFFVRSFEPMLVSFERAGLGSRYDRTRDDVTDKVVRLYLGYVGQPDNRRLGEAVEFTTRSLAAVLMRAVCAPGAFAKQMGFDDERLVKETTAMATAYLDDAVSRLSQ